MVKSMNNKGFSLIELIIVISLIAVVSIIIVNLGKSTLSLTEEEAYKIIQTNIINATGKYILECENKLIECSYKWNDNKTSIKASNLIEAGYFDTIINPINNKDISDCLVIEIELDNEKYKYKINDKDCK